ncbi:MAG: glycosyltransferase [Clostridium sp.]|nr:glycosyltransferase [Clostridium sp.]
MVITIIIPCYRSENTLEFVVNEIKDEILKRSGNEYQIILVNDCSPDNTFGVITKLAQADKNIIGVDLARNYGQNIARMAAVSYIKGDVAVCMDDDGQHPADQIYKLVDKVSEGYDLVYAKFATQKQQFYRRFTSRINTKLLELTGSKMKGIYNSPFLAWSKFAIGNLKAYKSPFPSAGAYLMRTTNRVTNVEVEQRKRISGTSGYTLKKLVNLWLTEFTNFSLVPLRLASLIGVCTSGLGICWGFFLVIRKIINPHIAMGYTSTMAVLLFIGGIIMLMLGLIGEYIGKIYMTISDLPQYIVREALNADV